MLVRKKKVKIFVSLFVFCLVKFFFFLLVSQEAHLKCNNKAGSQVVFLLKGF